MELFLLLRVVIQVVCLILHHNCFIGVPEHLSKSRTANLDLIRPRSYLRYAHFSVSAVIACLWGDPHLLTDIKICQSAQPLLLYRDSTQVVSLHTTIQVALGSLISLLRVVLDFIQTRQSNVVPVRQCQNRITAIFGWQLLIRLLAILTTAFAFQFERRQKDCQPSHIIRNVPYLMHFVSGPEQNPTGTPNLPCFQHS